MSEFDNAFDRFIGLEIPGGCEECGAYQIIAKVEPGIWSIVIHHDKDCPGRRSRAIFQRSSSEHAGQPRTDQ